MIMTEKEIEIPELGITVADADEYCQEASEILDDYLLELSKKEGYTRPVNEDDLIDNDDMPQFIWAMKGTEAYEAELGRLYEIGRKYFGEDADLDINSSMYQKL